MKKEKCILDSKQVQAQKEYIINVFGIKLFDSEETPNKSAYRYKGHIYRGYVYLAMQYWPEIFNTARKKKYRIEVHHLNKDRNDNRLCNLVPLTSEQHINIHKLFDTDTWEERCNKCKERTGDKNPFFNHTHTNETKKHLSDIRSETSMPEYVKAKISKSCKEHPGGPKGQHWYKDENGNRIYYKEEV